MFSNDDILFEGPLAYLVSKSLSNDLTFVHQQLAGVTIGLVSLHIAVVLFNRFYKKDDIISPMLDGNKSLPPRLAQQAKTLRFAPRSTAVLCFVFAVALVASIVLL